MPLFTSRREKRLWLWALLVLLAIFSTLFVGRPLAELFGNQDVQAVIFLLGMLLVAAAILIHALKSKPDKFELAVWVGITAVYIMFILRLGLAERSHLIEYSVLAILIHKALKERLNSEAIMKPALLALIITFLLGVFDECLQLFIPDRHFDPTDIVFNGIAISMAIGSSALISWIRKIRKKRSS